ncbi:MAG: hypothetical protein NWE96_04345 [Candidatus Bathyarchaeota archaeon]|nr:hypothetical protein [Candidatus Bathyarchaeota archaeon]
MHKLGKNEKSLAGEFFTVAQLFVHGYLATPTLGKTKHMDIFAVNPNNSKRIIVEVKTTDEKTGLYNTKPFGSNYEWIMDKKNEDIVDDNLFYCFVLLRENQLPRFFIVPSRNVAEYLKWEHEQWMNYQRPNGEMPKETTIRTFRVGLKSSNYEIGLKYEDNWSFQELDKKNILTPVKDYTLKTFKANNWELTFEKDHNIGSTEYRVKLLESGKTLRALKLPEELFNIYLNGLTTGTETLDKIISLLLIVN